MGKLILLTDAPHARDRAFCSSVANRIQPRGPVMKLSLRVLLSFVLGFTLSRPGHAGTVVAALCADFGGTVGPGANIVINTACLGVSLPPISLFTVRDQIRIAAPLPVRIFVASYAFGVIIGDPQLQSLSLVDVYALDVTSGGGPLRLTGFSSSSPEITPLSNETFTGYTGVPYSAPVNATTVGQLSTLYPNLDFSAFGGDPNSIVYTAQADVNPNDFVPEPGTSWSLAGGLACLVWLKRSAGRFRHRCRL